MELRMEELMKDLCPPCNPIVPLRVSDARMPELCPCPDTSTKIEVAFVRERAPRKMRDINVMGYMMDISKYRICSIGGM